MNVYCYYEETAIPFQTDLINLWKESWKQAGFEPVVLDKKTAETSLFYEDYLNFVQTTHLEIRNEELPYSKYHLACHLKLLAFFEASKNSGPALFCDYDVINFSFKETDLIPQERLHWMDLACTCICQGGHKGWISYFEFLFSEKQSIIEFLSKRYLDRKCLHDQDYLEGIFQKGVEQNVFFGTRKFVGPVEIGKEQTKPLTHVSNHSAAKRLKADLNREMTDITGDQRQLLRLRIAKEVLKIIPYKPLELVDVGLV